jgi:hypothetical protein
MPYGMYPASPSIVRQAPDNKALFKSAILEVASQPLETPAVAQNYFEPGVNTKLRRRKTPKTNYTMPSDPVSFPLGFVPTNREGRVAGEEPSIIASKVAVPGDLLAVFARIEREEKALAAIPTYGVDMGQGVANDYMAALKEKSKAGMMDKLVNEGNTEAMVEEAMKANTIASLQRKLTGMK